MVLSSLSLQCSGEEIYWTNDHTEKCNFITAVIALKERGNRAHRICRETWLRMEVSLRKWWLNWDFIWGVNWIKKGGKRVQARGGSMCKAPVRGGNMVQLRNERRLVDWNGVKEGKYRIRWGQKSRRGQDHSRCLWVMLRILVFHCKSPLKISLFTFLKFIFQTIVYVHCTNSKGIKDT